MTTTQPQPDREPTIGDVLQELTKVNDRIDKLSDDLEKLEKWQDRTWDAVKWAISLSTGLSITAAATLFGLAIRAFLIGA